MADKMDDISQPIPSNSGSPDKIFNSKPKIAYNLNAAITLATLVLLTLVLLYRILTLVLYRIYSNSNPDQSTYKLKAANTLAILSVTLVIVSVLYCIHSYNDSTRSQPHPPEHTNSNPVQLNNPNQTFTYEPKIDYSPTAANTITDQLNSNTDKTNSKPRQTNTPNQKFVYKPDIEYKPMAANTMTNCGK